MNNKVLDVIDKLSKGASVDLCELDEQERMYVESCMLYNKKDYEKCITTITKLYNDYGILDMDLAICVLFFYLTACNVDDKVLDEFYLAFSKHEDQLSDQQKSCMVECVNVHVSETDNPSRSVIKNFKKYIVEDYFQVLSNMIDFYNLDGKNVINAYYNASSSGVGDFLRGCCYLADLLHKKRINFMISFDNHDLGTYVKSKCNIKVSTDKIFDTEKHRKEYATQFDYFINMENNIANELNNSKNKDVIIFSSYSDKIGSEEDDDLSKECQSFMKDNIIFNEDVEKTFSDLDLLDYEVIHFRLGDHECSSHLSKTELDVDNINTKNFDLDYEKLSKSVISSYLNSKKTTIVMSDSNKFKEYIKKNIIDKTDYDIRVTHEKSQHSSDNPGFIKSLEIDRRQKINNMYYVALDMKILSKSQKIHSFSVYPWGSGFCYWIARIFDIDIHQNSV